MNAAQILLFHSSPGEQGWESEYVESEEYSPHIIELTKAMLFDIAETCAALPGARVLLHTTSSATLTAEEIRSLPVEHRVQPDETLIARVIEAVASLYKEDTGTVVIVVLMNNPLFLGERIERARQMLHMEEEVVVVAEGIVGETSQVKFVATRGFHPMAYESVRSFSHTGALMIPLASVKCVTNIEDMVFLLHEIERADLLGRPFPERTFTKLNWMRKKQFIPEYQ